MQMIQMQTNLRHRNTESVHYDHKPDLDAYKECNYEIAIISL